MGDRIRLHMTYDDGWCLGENLDINLHQRATNQLLISKGVFPRDCIGGIPLDDEDLKDLEDRPLNASPSTLQRVPTLPPLDLGDYYTPTTHQDSKHDSKATSRVTSLMVPNLQPAIRISSPFSGPETPRHSDVISQFPPTPTPQPDPEARLTLQAYRNSFGIINSPSVKKQQRISSLIAGRDAQLFMELGEALGHD